MNEGPGQYKEAAPGSRQCVQFELGVAQCDRKGNAARITGSQEYYF